MNKTISKKYSISLKRSFEFKKNYIINLNMQIIIFIYLHNRTQRIFFSLSFCKDFYLLESSYWYKQFGQ